MRSRHCDFCNQWHPVEEWPAECSVARPAPSHGLSCPMVISDNISPSELGGKMITSKRQWSAETRARGLEIVGTETKYLEQRPSRAPDRAGIRESLKKAFAS